MKKMMILTVLAMVLMCNISFAQGSDNSQAAINSEKVEVVEPSITRDQAEKETTVEAETGEETTVEAVAISIETKETVSEEESAGEKTSQSCSISSKNLQELEELYKEYDELFESGNRGEIEGIKNRIRTMEQKIEKERESCVISGRGESIEGVSEEIPVSITPVSSETVVAPEEAENASEIVDYYKSKTTSILYEEDDIEIRIAGLKELRDEINQLIVDLIQERNRIRVQEMQGVVSQVKVRTSEIEVDGVLVPVQETKRLTAAVNGNEIEVETSSEEVKIVDSGVEATTEEVVFEDEKIKVNGKEIKVLPAQVQNKVNGDIQEMKLTSEAVYEVTSVKESKMLWVVPAQVQIQSQVNAENGELLSEEKPWWNFLVTE